jgi:hypothetical protein
LSKTLSETILHSSKGQMQKLSPLLVLFMMPTFKPPT